MVVEKACAVNDNSIPNEIEAAVRRAASVVDRVAESIGPRDLSCLVCGARRHAAVSEIRGFLDTGWPECCSQTMRLK